MTHLAHRMNIRPVFCTAFSLRLYIRSRPNRLCHNRAIILSMMPEYLEMVSDQIQRMSSLLTSK